jgi:plastocyanin
MGQSIAVVVVVAVFAPALLSIRGQVASADEAAQASRASTVTIAHFEFQPPTLTISPGTKVRFSNTSGTAHTATRKGSFHTGRIKPGKSASVTFNRKGTFSYHCSIHPFMKGKIVVD